MEGKIAKALRDLALIMIDNFGNQQLSEASGRLLHWLLRVQTDAAIGLSLVVIFTHASTELLPLN